MTTPWKPTLGPDGLPFPRIFLSASIPSPSRDLRFLSGPAEPRLMVRVIETRVRDAVASFVVNLLRIGGQLIFGGHPAIVPMVAAAAANFSASDEEHFPILLYQSEHFCNAPAPAGREELEAARLAEVHWVPVDREEAAGRFHLESPFLQDEKIFDALPRQERRDSPVDETLETALTVLRVVMCLHRQPQAIFSMGGMEGIGAEAQIFRHLLVDASPFAGPRAADGPGLGNKPMAFALRSTYGAVAGLGVGTTDFIDQSTFDGDSTDLRFGPIPGGQLLPVADKKVVARQLMDRIRYDGIMQKFVQRIAGSSR